MNRTYFIKNNKINYRYGFVIDQPKYKFIINPEFDQNNIYQQKYESITENYKKKIFNFSNGRIVFYKEYT